MPAQTNTPEPAIRPVIIEMIGTAPPGEDWIERCTACLLALQADGQADAAQMREAAARLAEDPAYATLTPEEAAARYMSEDC